MSSHSLFHILRVFRHVFGQNGGDNSIFMKILKDFDDSMQNKCIEMCVFAYLESSSSDSTSFWFKICEEKTSLLRDVSQ